MKFPKANPGWGCDRIQGALVNVGYHISDRIVGNVLKTHGIEPVPDRTPNHSWKTFMKAYWETIFATDFTTVEVWTKRGLTTFYLMMVMSLETRRIEIAGVTTNPTTNWMRQVCRNLTGYDGFLNYSSHLIVDRDASFRPLRKFLHEQTEIECVSRTVYAEYEIRMLEPDDLLWTQVARTCFEGVCSALSLRAKSSGIGQRIDYFR